MISFACLSNTIIEVIQINNEGLKVSLFIYSVSLCVSVISADNGLTLLKSQGGGQPSALLSARLPAFIATGGDMVPICISQQRIYHPHHEFT